MMIGQYMRRLLGNLMPINDFIVFKKLTKITDFGLFDKSVM